MDQAGLVIDEVSYCSGLMSQKLTWLHRRLGILPLHLGWFVTLPLRPLAILIDRPVTAMMRWPHSSICVEAYKRRWLENVSEGRQ